MREAHVFRKPMAGPNDVSGIVELFENGLVEPGNIVGILGKTEGNGCVNDFTRGYATQSLRHLLSQYLDHDAVDQIGITMSGGTEGGLSPHWLVFAVTDESEPENAPDHQRKSLALGHTITQAILPTQLGKIDHVKIVSEAVTVAMERAGIDDPKDVHYVQIKCPLLSSEQVSDPDHFGQLATKDTLSSMGYSRGASALGVAVALNEIALNALSDDVICKQDSLFSARASSSAGVELNYCEILVMGMSAAWSGPLAIAHDVMADAIDVEPLLKLLRPLRTANSFQLTEDERQNVIGVLAKAGASSSGHIRGHRHTMLNDSDISPTRHARGFVGGALAAVIGHSALFVSGGAEHQGPSGGGPVAIIYKRSE